MRHGAQAVFGDKLAGNAADAIRLVVDARKGVAQLLYELLLTVHKALNLGTLCM